MSQRYYEKLLHTKRRELLEIVAIDQKLVNKKTFVNRDGLLINHRTLYIRYAQIANNLCEIDDNIQDPKLSDQTRRLFQLTVGRFLQLKDELLKVEADIYAYLHDQLIPMNLTPYDVRLKIPSYYHITKEEKQKKYLDVLEEVKILIQFEEAEDEDEEDEEEEGVKEKSHKLSSIINFLQKALLQGRDFSDVSEKDSSKESDHLASFTMKKAMNESRRRATRIVCIYFKKYLKKKQFRQLIRMEHQFQNIQIMETDLEGVLKSQNIKIELKEKFEDDGNKLKETLERRYKYRIIEDIQDEIREWYLIFYEITKEFPDLPTETLLYTTGQTFGVPRKLSDTFLKENFPIVKSDWPKSQLGLSLSNAPQYAGSALVQTGFWITPEEYVLCKSEIEQAKKNKGENKRLEKKPKGKLKSDKVKELKFEINESDCLPAIRRVEENIRIGENRSDGDREEELSLKKKVFKAINIEIRKDIDEEMRLELQLLQMSLRKKKQKRNKKNGKPKKSKKKKGGIGECTVEMVKELYKAGVLHEGDGSQLIHYIGELRLLPPPTPDYPGDIVDQVINYCVIPLGCGIIHQLAPLTRSICLVGPEHSAKKFLVDSIVTETSATLFDLSPERFVGKYENKKELKEVLKSVMAAAIHWQPSVIFVNEAHKLFYMKVPKEDRPMKPKQFAPLLTKIIKNIKAEAQVMVVATSSFPWLAKPKKFIKSFDKLLIVPSKNYGTYSIEWQKFFIDVSIPVMHTPFAKVDSNLAAGLQNMYEMERLTREAGVDCKGNDKPLIENFASIKPPKNLDKKYNRFLSKLPLEKKKQQLKSVHEELSRGKSTNNR